VVGGGEKEDSHYLIKHPLLGSLRKKRLKKTGRPSSTRQEGGLTTAEKEEDHIVATWKGPPIW